MAIQTPKTDWKAGDVVLASDMNRIESNILDLDTRVQQNTSSIAQISTNLSNLQQSFSSMLSSAIIRSKSNTRALSGTSFVPNFLNGQLAITNVQSGGIVPLNQQYAFLFVPNSNNPTMGGVYLIDTAGQITQWMPQSSFTNAGWSDNDIFGFLYSVAYNGKIQDWGYLYGEALGTIYGIELWRLFQKAPGTAPKKRTVFGGYGGTLSVVTSNKLWCGVSDEYNNVIRIVSADLNTVIDGTTNPLLAPTGQLIDNAEFNGTDVVLYVGKLSQNAKADRLCFMNGAGQVFDTITFSSTSVIGNYIQRSAYGITEFKTLPNGLVLLAFILDSEQRIALVLYDLINRTTLANTEFSISFVPRALNLYYISDDLFILDVINRTGNPVTYQHTLYGIRAKTSLLVNWLYQYPWDGLLSIDKIFQLGEGLFVQSDVDAFYRSVWLPLIRW